MANLRTDNLSGTGGRNAITGSVYFGGDNDKAGLSIADTTDLELGSETNWTIEFWVKLNHGALSDWDVIMGKGSSQGSGEYEWFVEVMAANHLIFLSTTAGVAWDFNQQITPVLKIGEWYHVAIVRNGSGSNTLKSYVNGVQYSTHTSQNIYTGNDPFGIGHFAFTKGLNSDVTLSNVRVVKGTSVYTAAFTPPTEKLTAVENTVLLCCQDSDNPTQEATGKTITGYGRYFAATGEKFANTGFTADSNWTKGSGWTIANGLATHAQGSAGDLYQAVSGLVVGQTYKLSVDILTSDEDVSYFYIDNNPGGNYPALGNGSDTYVGYHQIFFNANATTMNIGFRGSSLWAGTLTNLRLSSYEYPKAPKVLPPVGIDEGVTFKGDTKINSQGYMYFPTGDTSQRGRGRGTFSGGYTPSPSNTNLASIDYVQIQSLGNSIDFGDLTTGRYGGGGGASSTRGLQMGGRVSSTRVKTIDYITFATTSNATTFGDLTVINAYVHGASNNTRALNMGGGTPAVTDTIEYVTIASTGNGTDFGNLTDARGGAPAVASPTRACCMGGYDDSAWIDVIDYVTIASTGNATDFGDLSSAFGYGGGLSSNTRGIMGGGSRGSGEINDIVYITIASEGNAIDFGDLYAAREHTSATSNSIRGIWGGGVTPTYYNNIQYVTISTTGNANDFGDFIVDNSKAYSMTTSDSHGGLS